MASIRQYVEQQASTLGIERRGVRHVLSNLALAGTEAEAVASAFSMSLADKALQSLAKKIAKDKAEEEKRRKAADDNRPSKRPFGTNDDALLEHKDPFTGENLSVVYLLDDRKVLFNEHSKVVYPIPDMSKVDGEDAA